MASLRPPGLGPIIGHTTDTSCRIWIRAGDPADAGARLDANRRTVGVIGLVAKGKDKIEQAWYFRLQREFDRTGTFRLGVDVALGEYTDDIMLMRLALPGRKLRKAAAAQPLQPDTEYTVRLATLTLDDPLPDDEHLPDWKLRDRLPEIEALHDELLKLPQERCEASFRTFPGNTVDSLCFLLGSCRYPGLLWKVKEADRIFGPMLDQAASKAKTRQAPRFVLMVGDQIYADRLNRHIPIGRADSYEEFQERYVTAFSGPNLSQLLRQVPTYMILDDHEIEDNWTQDRLKDDAKHGLFNIAISAYMSYQWSHGPRTWGRLLYSDFECGGYPFFLLDTRTQRFKDDDVGLRDNHMLGRPVIDPLHPGQLQRLLEWLTKQQKARGDAPKFIITASVFVPNAMDERLWDDARPAPPDAESAVLGANQGRREKSDSWPAYPNTRRDILRCIVDNKIQNVVFLSGDIHCSNVAEMEFDGAPGIRAFAITSSAFYWPFPFADGDPNAYVHDSRADGQQDPFPILGTNCVMHYRAYGFTQEDNFSRIEIDRKAGTLRVSIFDRDGINVKTGNANGKLVAENVLRLQPW